MENKYDGIRSMHNTSEIVKLRRVVERIEKKLNEAFKILDDDDEENRTYQLNKKKY